MVVMVGLVTPSSSHVILGLAQPRRLVHRRLRTGIGFLGAFGS